MAVSDLMSYHRPVCSFSRFSLTTLCGSGVPGAEGTVATSSPDGASFGRKTETDGELWKWSVLSEGWGEGKGCVPWRELRPDQEGPGSVPSGTRSELRSEGWIRLPLPGKVSPSPRIIQRLCDYPHFLEGVAEAPTG